MSLLDKIDLLVWDNDGVLANTEILHIPKWREIASRFGLNISLEETARRTKGKSSLEAGGLIAAESGQSTAVELAKLFNDEVQALYREHLKPIEGIDKVVRSIKKLQCVVSNAFNDELEIRLRAVGLFDDLSPHLHSAASQGVTKAKLLGKVLEHYGVQPDRAVMIEDSKAGLVAAQSHGIKGVGLAAHPFVTVDELAETGAPVARNSTELADILGLSFAVDLR